MQIVFLIISFITISVGALFAISSFSARDCLDIADVRVVFEKSKALEAQGHLQRARQGYKQIDLFSCNRSEEQDDAIDRMMALGKNIHEAYDVTMKLIAIYHQKHSEYPSDLDAIRMFVPENYIQAFNGFILVTKDDGTVDIVTGLYGSVAFNLN